MMLFYGFDYPSLELFYVQKEYMQHVITKDYKVSALTEVKWTVGEEGEVAVIEVPVEESEKKEVKREKLFEVYFAFDSARLSPEVKERLSLLEPASYFLVGHACWIGKEKYNNRLSLKRAYSVAEFLRSRGLTVVGLDYRGEQDCNLYKDLPVRKAKPLLRECRKVEVYKDVP